MPTMQKTLLSLLLLGLSACDPEALGPVSERAAPDLGCAVPRALQPNTTPADSGVARWITLDYTCGLKATPRTAVWTIDGGAPQVFEVDFLDGACFSAAGPGGPPASVEWSVQIFAGGDLEATVLSADLPADPSSALTWGLDGTPYLPGLPTCEPG